MGGRGTVLSDAAGLLSLRETVLATLASLGVFWSVLPGRAVEVFFEGLALPVVSTLVIRSALGAGTLGWLTNWTLYGYLIHDQVPRVFPSTVGDTTRTDGFRMLTTATTVALGVTVEAIAFKAWFSSSPVAGALGRRTVLVLGALAVVALLSYLIATRGWSIATIDGFPAGLLEAWTPFQRLSEAEFFPTEADPAAVLGSVGTAGLGVLGGLLLWLYACAFVAVLAVVIGAFYPLPELLVLGWVAVTVVRRHRPGLVEGLPSREAVDLETRVVTATRVALRGPKGLVALGYVVVGIFMSLFFFLMLVGVLGAFIRNPGVAVGLTPSVVAVLGFSIGGAAVYGFYGLWYWLRMLARLPHFLAAWTAETSPEASSLDRDELADLPLLARPPGLMLPPSLLLVVVNVYTFRFSDPPAVPLLLWLPWGAAVGLVCWSVRRATGREPRGALSDRWAFPAAFAVQYLVFAILFDAVEEGGFLDAIESADPIRVFDAVAGFTGLLPVVFVAGFFVADAFVAITAERRARRYLGYAFLTGFGALLALLLLAGVGADRVVDAGLAVLLAAAVLVGGWWYHRGDARKRS